MKKEVILFYIINDYIYIYLRNAKREIKKQTDTSFFFKFGEIKDIKAFSKKVSEVIDEEKILTGLLKPKMYVLYNDITNCDLKYLYEIGLSVFNYDFIEFVPITKIVKMVSDSDNLVLFDKDYYTIFKYNYKTNEIKNVDFKPIFIGKNSAENIHYADADIIWKTFISCFTKN